MTETTTNGDKSAVTDLAGDLAAAQETPAARFSFKRRAAPMHIEIDLDALSWEDNIQFARVQAQVEKGELSEEQGLNAVTDLLSKLAGLDVRKLPMTVVVGILSEFRKLSEVRADEEKN